MTEQSKYRFNIIKQTPIASPKKTKKPINEEDREASASESDSDIEVGKSVKEDVVCQCDIPIPKLSTTGCIDSTTKALSTLKAAMPQTLGPSDETKLRALFYFNATKYLIGVLPISLFAGCFGALIGWGFGAGISKYQKPCIKKDNDHQVKKCSYSSPQAENGATYGALTFSAITLFGGVVRVSATPLIDSGELGIKKGIEESAATLGGCLAAFANND